MWPDLIAEGCTWIKGNEITPEYVPDDLHPADVFVPHCNLAE